MSKEMDLLKRILVTGWLDHELSCEVEKLLAQPEQDLDALKKDWVNFGYTAGKREQLLAQPEQEEAPVATKLEGHQFTAFHVSADDFKKLKKLPTGTRLYTSPKREPLSEQEITDLWANKSPANEFECVRLVEKAHGITGGGE